MRVLIFNYEFPPIGGGAGTATANIARCLAARGDQVLVLTSRFGKLPVRERRDNFEIVRVPVIRRQAFRCTPAEMLTYLAGGFWPTLAAGRRWRPDVTCAFHGIPCGPLSLALRRTMGTPYLVSLRGGDVPGFLRDEIGWMHSLTRPFIRSIWEQAASVVANSEGLADLARETWPAGAIGVIPNGVDVDRFRPSDRERPASPFRLLCVGRLVHQKGIRYLIEALRCCRKPVVLRLVGDGPDRPMLTKLVAAAGLQQRVEFVGWADRPELIGHYQWADAFAFPSLEEGMSNAMLEALAAGLPIVTTRVYGNAGLVETGLNGLLVRPGESKELAAAIERLIADPEWTRRLGKTSREIALGFSWESTAEQYHSLLQAASGKR